jgi:arylsulfatase A-like enzyme
MKGSYANSMAEVAEALNEVYFEDKREKRKFVYLHLVPPHRPYEAPGEFRIFNTTGAKEIDNFQHFLGNIKEGNISPNEEELNYIESMYDANVLYADAIVKRLYEFLDGNGLLGRTILIITSDHGEASKMEHGELGHNTTLYDEMIHIPFVIKLPIDLGQEGRTVTSLSAILDIAPTVLDLFGMKPADGFEGHSLLPQIFGQDDTKSERFVFLDNPGARQLGIRGTKYKYISTFQQKMLFDLSVDPEERENLYTQRVVAGYYEQRVNKEYDFQPIEVEKESEGLDGLSEEEKRKLRELGYIR